MSENLPVREVAASWDALEDAFENNAPEVHSYLHLDTGEVIRLVDGVADPTLHSRIVSDGNYLRIDPVSSREQYRWMERFIATVEDAELRHKLFRAIDGKGAFRRFKDVLMTYPLDRERWFVFRSERVRACMESWLTTHQVEITERPEWNVPTADDVATPVTAEGAEEEKKPKAEEAKQASKPEKGKDVEHLRSKLVRLSESVPSYDLEIAVSFLEFLTERSFSKREARAPHHVVVTTAGTKKIQAAPGVEVVDPGPRNKDPLAHAPTPTAPPIGDGVLFASQLPPDPKNGAN